MSDREQDMPDNGDESADRYNVPALERGLRVLGEFSRDTRTLTAPELARRFKLPRSTVFRLLATLEGMGFVERDEVPNQVHSMEEFLNGLEMVIVMVGHSQIKGKPEVFGDRILIDPRNVCGDGENVYKL